MGLALPDFSLPMRIRSDRLALSESVAFASVCTKSLVTPRDTCSDANMDNRKHFVLTFLGVISLLAASSSSFAQITRREFVAPDAANDDRLGSAVTATSLYTIAGAPGDDVTFGVDAGSVSVFDAATGRLHRRLVAPDGAPGDEFGTAVAASGDYLVVGAPKKDPSVVDGGAVYIFRLSTGAFVRRIDGGGVAGDVFGSSVAIWGKYIVVGAPGADQDGGVEVDAGDAYLCTLDNSLPPARLETGDVIAGGSSFGTSVAIDNFTIAVGVPNQTLSGMVQTGSVYLFTIHPVTGVATEATRIAAPDATAEDGYGWAVAMYGNSLVVGAPFRTAFGAVNGGRVRVHPNVARDMTGLFTDAYDLRSGYASGQFLGSSVAISGLLVAAGAPAASVGAVGNGYLEVYGYYPRGFNADGESGILTYAADLADSQSYGSAVAAYGNRVVIGARGDSSHGFTGAGAVHQGGPLRPTLSDKSYSRGQRMGSSASGTGGAVFASFSEAMLSSSEAFVLTKLAGPGVTAANGKAVFLDSSSQTSRHFRTGPNFPFAVKDIYGLLPGDGGSRVQGMVRFTGPGVTSANDLGVFSHDGTTLTPIVVEGDTAGPSTVTKFLQVRASHGYRAAMTLALKPNAAVTASSDSALRRSGGDLLREGVGVSSAGPLYGQFSRLSMAGQVIYPCALQSGPADNVILESQPILGGGRTMITRKGTPAPSPGGGGVLTPYQTFLGEVMNAAGGYAFRATMALGAPSVTVADNEGLWANNAVGGALQLCVRKGDSHPSLPLVKFKRFLHFGIDSSVQPRLLFLAQLQGPGVNSSNDLSLWVHDGFSLVQLLREGDYAPGNARGKIGTIQRLDLEPVTRTYTVLCGLTSERGGIDAGSNQMLLTGYFGSTGAALTPAFPILSKGQRFNRIGPDRIRSINFLTPVDRTGALAAGWAQAFGGNRVLCQVEFSRTDKEVIQIACNP